MGTSTAERIAAGERDLSFTKRCESAAWYRNVFGGPLVLPDYYRASPKDVAEARNLLWC